MQETICRTVRWYNKHMSQKGGTVVEFKVECRVRELSFREWHCMQRSNNDRHRYNQGSTRMFEGRRTTVHTKQCIS